MTDEEERRHLEVAESELTQEFPTVPPLAIHHALEVKAEEFRRAPIRDFVPLLVRRHVRAQLRAERVL